MQDAQLAFARVLWRRSWIWAYHESLRLHRLDVFRKVVDRHVWCRLLLRSHLVAVSDRPLEVPGGVKLVLISEVTALGLDAAALFAERLKRSTKTAVSNVR